MDNSQVENINTSGQKEDQKRLTRRQSNVTSASLAGDRAISETGSMLANTIDSYSASVASTKFDDQQAEWSRIVGPNRPGVRVSHHQKYYGVVANEPLLDGFMLLRLMQLLNFDVYYIGLHSSPSNTISATSISSSSEEKLTANDELINESAADLEAAKRASTSSMAQEPYVEPNIMDEVAELNPLHRIIDQSRFLRAIFRYLKICLSLVAILISVDKLLSTILLCLLGRMDSKSHSGSAKAAIGVNFEASDVSMSWFVLILINLSSTYILFSTVFNGHLLWNLFSQRLFLVSRRFQYKTMLSLLVFVYLEYIINISFINNLFGWSFVSNDLDNNNINFNSDHNIHGGYSVVNNLRKFVTEQDDEHHYIDIILTIIQFARGIIRISPYITIVYAIICLKEHIKTIRNQYLLTDSLKKRQKLRLVVKNRRDNLRGTLGSQKLSSLTANGTNGLNGMSKKKRVIFVTETSGERPPVAGCSSDTNSGQQQLNAAANAAIRHLQEANMNSTASTSNGYDGKVSVSPMSLNSNRSLSSLGEPKVSNMMKSNENDEYAITSISMPPQSPLPGSGGQLRYPMRSAGNLAPARQMSTRRKRRSFYLDRVRDFDELESYITNLYIFTGRLNRLMSRQGLAMFFIVHNLVISCSLIVPEAIRGGPPMVYTIRLLVIVIGIVPFIYGQLLNGQLKQLSKQIDRIIIQQQFISRRRDNLVRIRELLHDIRVNCGGMLNFNVETGIKYLVIAFASAFFIEQEGKFCCPFVCWLMMILLQLTNLYFLFISTISFG